MAHSLQPTPRMPAESSVCGKRAAQGKNATFPIVISFILEGTEQAKSRKVSSDGEEGRWQSLSSDLPRGPGIKSWPRHSRTT